MQTPQRQDALSAAYSEPNPNRPGADEVRLKGSGISVWAIVGKYRAASGDTAAVAGEYDVPVEAIEAAIAYYHAHKEVIDSRRAANYPEAVD